MARYAHITGWGMGMPQRVMTNDDWAQLVDTSDEWIRSRTGVVERRIAGEGESTLTLSMEAARQALEVAGISPAQLDLIIVGTLTPEYMPLTSAPAVLASSTAYPWPPIRSESATVNMRSSSGPRLCPASWTGLIALPASCLPMAPGQWW